MAVKELRVTVIRASQNERPENPPKERRGGQEKQANKHM